MDTGKQLSVREQRILAEMEAMLRRDRKLDDRLRNLRMPAWLRLVSTQRRLRGAELALLIPTTIVLSLAAAHTAGLGLVIACSCVGAITLLLLAGVARDRRGQRRTGHVTTETGTWRGTAL